MGVLPQVSENISTDLPELRGLIPATFLSSYSFIRTQVSDVAGLYACKLLGDEAVEDFTGLTCLFHPFPTRRKVQFRLSMNICEICVVFFGMWLERRCEFHVACHVPTCCIFPPHYRAVL